MNEHLKKVWEYMKSKGEDVGSFPDFQAAVQDDANLEQVHSYMKKAGEDVGDLDTFKSIIHENPQVHQINEEVDQLQKALNPVLPSEIQEVADQQIAEDKPNEDVRVRNEEFLKNVETLARPIADEQISKTKELIESPVHPKHWWNITGGVASGYMSQSFPNFETKAIAEAKKKTLYDDAVEFNSDLIDHPSLIHDFINPGKSKEQLRQANLLESGLKGSMNEDGEINIRKYFGGEASFDNVEGNLEDKYMTPSEILATNEIPGVGKEQLDQLKRAVVSQDIKRKQLDLQQVGTSREYLEAKKDNISPEIYEASKLKLDSQEAAIDEKYPQVKLYERYDQDLSDSNDEKKAARSQMEKAVLGVSEFVIQGVTRGTESLYSTYLATLAAAGNKGAEEKFIRRSMSPVEQGTFRASSKEERPISERLANYGKYQISYDASDNPIAIYDENGYPAKLTSEARDKIFSQAVSDGNYKAKIKRRWNSDAVWNNIQDAGSDLLTTFALAGALGRIVPGSGGVAMRVREALPILFQYSGSIAEQALAQGASPTEAAIDGYSQGFQEMATEALFPFIGKYTGGPKKAIKTGLKRTLAEGLEGAEKARALRKLTYKEALGHLMGVPGEAAEEGISSLAQPLINEAFNAAWNTQLDDEMPDFASSMEQASLGGILSVIPSMLGAGRALRLTKGSKFYKESIYSLVSDPEKTKEVAKLLKNPKVDEFIPLIEETYNSEKANLNDKKLTESQKVQLVSAAFDRVKAQKEAGDAQGGLFEEEINAKVETAKKAEEELKAKIKEEVKTKEKEEKIDQKAGKLSDEEWSDFVDNNVVSNTRLNQIAVKIKRGNQLSRREESIRQSRNAEIDALLAPGRTSTPSPVVTTGGYSTSLRGDLNDNLGQNVNYQGIEGTLHKDDESGLFYVLDKNKKEEVIRGAETGLTAEELGLTYVSHPFTSAELSGEKDVQIEDNEVETDFTNNTVKLRGENFTYVSADKDGKSVTLLNSKGQKRTVRKEIAAKIILDKIHHDEDTGRATKTQVEDAIEEVGAIPAGRVQPGGPSDNNATVGKKQPESAKERAEFDIALKRETVKKHEDDLIAGLQLMVDEGFKFTPKQLGKKLYGMLFNKKGEGLITDLDEILDPLTGFEKVITKRKRVATQFANIIIKRGKAKGIQQLMGEKFVEDLRKAAMEYNKLTKETSPGVAKKVITKARREDQVREAKVIRKQNEAKEKGLQQRLALPKEPTPRLPRQTKEKVASDRTLVARILTAAKEFVGTKAQAKRDIADGVFGIVTGENPNDTQLTPEDNAILTAKAEKWLRAAGYIPVKMAGGYKGKVGTSFYVPGMSKKHVTDFAKQFQQESVATHNGLIAQDGSILSSRNRELDNFDLKITDLPENFSAIKTKEGNVIFSIGYSSPEEVANKKNDAVNAPVSDAVTESINRQETEDSAKIQKLTKELSDVGGLKYTERVDKLVEAGVIDDTTTTISGRPVIMVNIAGVKIPFYRSLYGTSGKTKGKWFPFFGFGKNDAGDSDEMWFVKGTITELEGNFGLKAIKEYSDLLNTALNWNPDEYKNVVKEQQPLNHLKGRLTEKSINQTLYGSDESGIVNDGQGSTKKAYGVLFKIKEATGDNMGKVATEPTVIEKVQPAAIEKGNTVKYAGGEWTVTEKKKDGSFNIRSAKGDIVKDVTTKDKEFEGLVTGESIPGERTSTKLPDGTIVNVGDMVTITPLGGVPGTPIEITAISSDGGYVKVEGKESFVKTSQLTKAGNEFIQPELTEADALLLQDYDDELIEIRCEV